MRIGEQIKNYRKQADLTQEQIADYLGVSTPAVNKWEKGSTYPDISLLPALARLLKIDMNELFSFREEMTELEISQFAEELSEMVLEGKFVSAFERAAKKIQEYPHCHLLLYMMATILNSGRAMASPDEVQKEEYENQIISWLEQCADSDDEKVRMSAFLILASKYNQRQDYQRASLLLDKIPSTTVDTTPLRTEILLAQKDENAAAIFLESNFMQTATRLQGYFYKLIEIEERSGNHKKADEIAEIAGKMVPLLGLWNYGAVVPHLILAVNREDEELSIKFIRKTLEEAMKPWNMEESPLYYRITKKSAAGVGKSFIHALVSEMESDKSYDFLRNNEEFQKILWEYKEKSEQTS